MRVSCFILISTSILFSSKLSANGAKILFFCPVPTYSHQKMYRELSSQLSMRGHKVFMVTPNPGHNKSMTNLTEYDISSMYEFRVTKIKPEWKLALFHKPTFLGMIVRQFVIQWFAGDGMEYLYNHPEVKRLVKEHNYFDACVIEWFHPAVAVYGHLFQCSTIGIGSNGLPVQMLDVVGKISHPITEPEQDLPILRNRITFRQRLWSAFWAVFVRLHHKYSLLPSEDARIRKYYGNDIPYLGALERNMSLIILNRNPIFHRPVANPPNVVELESIKYDRPKMKIDINLRRFLDDAKKGVIYFSLGTSMDGVSMPQKYVAVFQSTFRKLPYNVVWKWENSSMQNKPPNVFINKFVPQTYVLDMFRISVLVIFVSIFFEGFVDTAKILFLCRTPAVSHQKPFQVIWKALSLRGHDVHVLTPNPLNDPSLTNLTEYDLSDQYGLLGNLSDGDRTFFLHKPTFVTSFMKDMFTSRMFCNFYNKTLTHKETRRLLHNNKHFDVVIVEWLFPTLSSFGAYYDAPIVGITSLGAPIVALDTLGNPSHPIVAPDMNLPLKRVLPLKERILSALYAVYVRLYYRLVVLPREDINIKRHLRSDLPYIGDIEKNISVLLLNRNPVFHRVMPLFPNTIEIGGIKFPTVRHKLKPEMERFLDNSKNGAIYFSLGSSMKSVLLGDDVISTLQNVFRSIPYNVVWKWENDTMEGKPENVYISKWIPQTTILEHPNVKLFITQGGLQSTEETIAAHKPIIGIPFHSDQTTNVDTCVMYGMGKMIDLEDLTEETLRSYIEEIMSNSSYSENAKKLDKLMKDQPQDGLEKAIWWIEYVIRHKGARHLRSYAVDLPWWQYLMLDVLAVVSAVILSFVFILYAIVKILFKLALGVFGIGCSDSNLKKKKEE